MKITDIKGDACIDTMADLIGPLGNIAEDEAAADLFKKRAVPKGMTAYSFTIKRVKEALPVLLRGHKDDLVFILAKINGMDMDEYRANMTIPRIIRDVVDMLNDEELTELFT